MSIAESSMYYPHHHSDVENEQQQSVRCKFTKIDKKDVLVDEINTALYLGPTYNSFKDLFNREKFLAELGRQRGSFQIQFIDPKNENIYRAQMPPQLFSVLKQDSYEAIFIDRLSTFTNNPIEQSLVEFFTTQASYTHTLSFTMNACQANSPDKHALFDSTSLNLTVEKKESQLIFTHVCNGTIRSMTNDKKIYERIQATAKFIFTKKSDSDPYQLETPSIKIDPID